MYAYPQQPPQQLQQQQQQQQQQESYGSYGPPPPLPSPYPSVQSYIPPSQVAPYASGDSSGVSFYQHGNGGNIASVGAGAGTEQSQYYGHNSGASIGQGHPYQSTIDNFQGSSFTPPFSAQNNGSGAVSNTLYGTNGETGLTGANPWVLGQQAQSGQQNYMVGGSATNGWGTPTSTLTSTPASATIPYEPKAFAAATPRPASYHHAPSSDAFASVQLQNPWSSSTALQYSHPFGDSSMHHRPPPLPPRPPSAINNHHTNNSTMQTSSLIQRKPISPTSANDGGNIQSQTVTSATKPQVVNPTTEFTGKAALPSLPPRYPIGLQQIIPLPPPPPLPPSQYYQQQQQQQQQNQQNQHQYSQIPPPNSTNTMIRPHQQNHQVPHQPSSASPSYSQQPVHPQNPANRYSMQPITMSNKVSYPQQHPALHHLATGYAHDRPAQQHATPIQSVAPTVTGLSAHQEQTNFNLPSRQNTDHYPSSISSSILYDSTPPPQKQATQPPPLPPPPPSQETPRTQAATNGHVAYQQGYDRANVNLSSVTSYQTASETQNTATAAPFITPVTTGTSIGTNASPSISSSSQPFFSQEKQQSNNVRANQPTEAGNYPTTFSIDTDPPDRRPVSPVNSLNSLNKVTSDNGVPTIATAAAPSSSQLAESPKSYAAELGLFASATGGLSGWGLYDDDNSMGNLSATTVKPGPSSALTTKKDEAKIVNEGTDGRETKNDSKSSEDRVAELPHHPMPTRNESGSVMQQQPRRRTTDSSIVSAISMPEGSSSSPVPSRPLLIERPSTPSSLRDGLGNADGKTSILQSEQQRKEQSVELNLGTSPDSLSRQKQHQAENLTNDSGTIQPDEVAENEKAETLSNQKEKLQSPNKGEALMVFSEPLLEALPEKPEGDSNPDRDRKDREIFNAPAVKDTDLTSSDVFSNVKSLTNDTSKQHESQAAASEVSPDLNKSEGPTRRTVYADSLDSRSRASLHRCIGMLHEEADAASTDEKVKIFIDFVTVEAFIRGIDLSAKLLPAKSEKENGGKAAKEPSPGLTPSNPTASPNMPPINNNIVNSTSNGKESSPILGSNDSFDDLSQGYSPGGRPIIQKPPRPERAVPRLNTPVASQRISRRTTTLPESEEKIFVEHESGVENQGSQVHRLIDRNSSTRKRAATVDILTPTIGDVTKQNSSGDDHSGNNNTAMDVGGVISSAAAGSATSAARSDVSSNTAITTPPGSDVDEGINMSEKKQVEQYQQQGQNIPPRPVSSASKYEPYTLLKSRLSMSPDTSIMSTAATSTARKRESIPLYKVHEQEMSAVFRPASASRRVGMSDEKRFSKVLSIVEPPIRMSAVENNSDGHPGAGRQTDSNPDSVAAQISGIATTATTTDAISGEMSPKCSIPSLAVLSTLLPRKISTRRTPSPLLQNIWDEISAYPSLASSPISLACTPLTGGREMIKEKEFSWIRDLYTSFNSQSTQIRGRLDIERQQRTEVAEQRTEQLFNDNEIGYADIGLREEEFRRDESENMARECREEYARFTAEVFGPVYGNLQNEIGRLLWLAEYVRERFLKDSKAAAVDDAGAVVTYELALGLKALETEDLPEKPLENIHTASAADDNITKPSAYSGKTIEPCTPSLDEVLCLYFCIYDKIEGRHERIVQAITDRDERYKKSELEPLSYNSSVDYSKIGGNGTASADIHVENGSVDGNNFNDPNTATSVRESVVASPSSSKQHVVHNKKREQQQNPRLRSLEQHFASAAHSAALRAAQDRHARLISILNSVSQTGSSGENIIHRALEITVTDAQKLTDAVKSVRDEALAASAATRSGKDGKGIEEKERIKASKTGIGIGSSKHRQEDKDESLERHGGDDREAKIQIQSRGNVGDKNEEEEGRKDDGNLAAVKQAAAGNDNGDDSYTGMTSTRLIKRAFRAISTLKDDSAQICSVVTMFKRNILRANHLVKVCEEVVKADSGAEQNAREKGRSNNDSIGTNQSESITDKDGTTSQKDAVDDTVTWPNDVVLDNDDDDDDDDDDDYRNKQEKLKKMEEFKVEIGKILGEVENLGI